MSDYVDIKTSPTDILLAANNLATSAGELETDMTGLVGNIEAQEGPGTWGGDDFATKFLDGGYHKVPDGATKPTATAVKDLGRGDRGNGDASIGVAGQNLANFVANAMLNYGDQDNSGGVAITASVTTVEV